MITNPQPEDKRQRNIAARILHFTGGKGDVVPRISGKKRTHLNHGEDHKKVDQDNWPADAHLHGMDACHPASFKELTKVWAKVRIPCGGVATHRESENHKRSQRECLGRREDILDDGAKPYAKDIHECEQEHNHDAREVGGVYADIHVSKNHRVRWEFRAHARCARANELSRWLERRLRGICRTRRRPLRLCRSG